MSEECLFCKIVAGDLPATVVHRDDQIVAFDDINPQAPTHVVIVPREHIPTLNDLDTEHETLFGKLATAARQIAASRGLADDGYRLVMNCNLAAGQSVWHIHMHLLGGRRLGWPPG